MMKVSVVMALYNTPYSYLKTTIESILNQTFKDFELIIVDDASNVNYDDFFAQFNDDRIKYIKLEKNAGPGHARNVGINLAAGEYIAIADSDDVYMQNRFEVQASFLDANPQVTIVGSRFRFSNKKNPADVVVGYDNIKTFMLFNSPFANPVVTLRKEFFLQNNLLYPEDKNFAEDYELWIDAMLKGAKLANLNDVLMIYTRRKNQLSKEKRENQIKILKELYEKIFKKLGLEYSQEELDLHFLIQNANFSLINNQKLIEDWFDKIIEQNLKCHIFSEQNLAEKKKEVLKNYNNYANMLFKIKLGNKNFCLSKNLKFYLQIR